MTKILLTRPTRLSQKIAKNLDKKNISSIVQSLFSIVQIGNLQPINTDPQAVLITSSSAIFALPKLAIKKDVLILAVGKTTALKIKKLGYQNVFTANNSAASLLDLALKKLSPNNGLILYLSGQIITLDLAKKLQEQNFEAKKIIVYKTLESAEFSALTISQINNGNVSEVWIYSKNSMKIFYKLAKRHNLLECLTKIKILCLTKSIADFANKINFLKTGLIKE